MYMGWLYMEVGRWIYFVWEEIYKVVDIYGSRLFYFLWGKRYIRLQNLEGTCFIFCVGWQELEVEFLIFCVRWTGGGGWDS